MRLVRGLPNTVQVGLAADTLRPAALGGGRLRDDKNREDENG
jgi:hypothetical protein